MPRSRTPGFKAGFVACALLGLSGIGYTANLAITHLFPEFTKRFVPPVKAWVVETFLVDQLFAEPMYLTQYYSDGRDGHKYQTWKLTLVGRNYLRGEIEDLETGNKGLINGYLRADTLTLSYASAGIDRPGLGTFILRPMHPLQAKHSVTYAGMAVVHECECQVAANPTATEVTTAIKSNGPMLTVPAILTSERVLPKEMAKIFFTKDPAQPDIVWPADVQRTVDARK